MGLLKASLATVMMLTAASRVEAASLRGALVLNENGGPPAAGIEVRAAGSESPGVADADGRFSLSFPALGPGDTVVLEIGDDSREVVNDLALEQVLAEDPDESPAVLLICRKGNRREMAGRLARRVAEETLEDHFRARLSELEKQQGDGLSAMPELQKGFDQASASLPILADQLTDQMLEAGWPTQRKAMRLFLGGKIRPAIDALDSAMASIHGEDSPDGEAGGLPSAVRLARSHLLKAQLLTLALRFYEADKAYIAAVAAAPDDLRVQAGRALFLATANRTEEAQQAYQLCLKLSKARGTAAQAAEALHQESLFLWRQKRLKEARVRAEEALRSFREMAAGGRPEHRWDLARVLRSLVPILRDSDDLKEAHAACAEAVDIHRRLAAENPDAGSLHLAMTLNELAAIQRALGRGDDARKSLDEALRICRSLAALNGARAQTDLALILENLSVLHQEQNRPREARKVLEELVAVYRDLAALKPEVYGPQVAGTLNSLGHLHREGQRTKEALRAYEDEIKVYRDLAALKPHVHLPYLALSQVALAKFHEEEKRWKEAARLYQEALKNYSVQEKYFGT